MTTVAFDESSRIDTPLRGDEAATLRAFLDFHRDTVRWKCSGLTQEQLAQRAAPSTLSLGGIMKHLALVEVGWFVMTMAGQPKPDLPAFEVVDWADPEWEWRPSPTDDPVRVRALYDEGVRLADQVVDAVLAGDAGLDATSAPSGGDDDESVSLRWVLVHMIEEYARHNGHADLIRESIDGETGV